MDPDDFRTFRETMRRLKTATTQEEQWEALDSIDEVIKPYVPRGYYTGQYLDDFTKSAQQAHGFIEEGWSWRRQFPEEDEQALEHVLTTAYPILYRIFENEKEEKSEQVKDMSSLLATEREPLSKLPADLANKVASYVSGEEGTMGVQMSKALQAVGKSGVHGKGRRKTKKNRVKRRKTHGRRRV
jgi:hypothetical protein